MDICKGLGDANSREFRSTYPQSFDRKQSEFQRLRDPHGEKKLKYPATESQNGFIHSLNGNELIADADDHNPSP